MNEIPFVVGPPPLLPFASPSPGVGLAGLPAGTQAPETSPSPTTHSEPVQTDGQIESQRCVIDGLDRENEAFQGPSCVRDEKVKVSAWFSASTGGTGRSCILALVHCAPLRR